MEALKSYMWLIIILFAALIVFLVERLKAADKGEKLKKLYFALPAILSALLAAAMALAGFIEWGAVLFYSGLLFSLATVGYNGVVKPRLAAVENVQAPAAPPGEEKSPGNGPGAAP